MKNTEIISGAQPVTTADDSRLNKMKRTARILSVIFKVGRIVATIGIVVSVVCALITLAGHIWSLPFDNVGTGFDTVTIGSVEMHITPENMPQPRSVYLCLFLAMLFASILFFVARMCISTVIRIFEPIEKGLPFDLSIGENLKKLAIRILIFGIVDNVAAITIQGIFNYTYNLSEMLDSCNTVFVSATESLRLGFIIVSAIMFMLGYIFSYGAQLQAQADETL